MKRIISLAFKNLINNERIFIIRTFSTALFISAIFTGIFLYRSIKLSVELGKGMLGADIVVLPQGSAEKIKESIILGIAEKVYMDSKILKELTEIEGVEIVSPQVFIESAQASCCSISNVFIIGVKPETDFILRGWMEEFKKIDKGSPLIAGASLGLKRGVSLKFYGHDFYVAGVLKKTGFGIIDDGAFIDIDTAYQLSEESRLREDVVDLPDIKDKITVAMVKLKKDADPEEVKNKIKYKIQGIDLITSPVFTKEIKEKLNSFLSAYFIHGVYAFLIWLLIFWAVIYMESETAVKDISAMFIMGYTIEEIKRMILWKGVFNGLFGGILSIILIVLEMIPMEDIFKKAKLPFIFPSPGDYLSLFLILLLFSIFFSSVFYIIPVRGIKSKNLRKWVRE